MRVIR